MFPFKVLHKAVWSLKLSSLIVNMSRGNLLHVWSALQYTTAHLQVLFSLQHLGRITKDLQ